MASSQELYNICLKTSLFKAKLCYNDFKKLFLLQRARNLEARRINCIAKEAKATGMRFLSNFHCSKNICALLLQILRSEWFLAFMLSIKSCFNAKKETLLSAYFFIAEIYTY